MEKDQSRTLYRQVPTHFTFHTNLPPDTIDLTMTTMTPMLRTIPKGNDGLPLKDKNGNPITEEWTETKPTNGRYGRPAFGALVAEYDGYGPPNGPWQTWSSKSNGREPLNTKYANIPWSQLGKNPQDHVKNCYSKICMEEAKIEAKQRESGKDDTPVATATAVSEPSNQALMASLTGAVVMHGKTQNELAVTQKQQAVTLDKLTGQVVEMKKDLSETTATANSALEGVKSLGNEVDHLGNEVKDLDMKVKDLGNKLDTVTKAVQKSTKKEANKRASRKLGIRLFDDVSDSDSNKTSPSSASNKISPSSAASSSTPTGDTMADLVSTTLSPPADGEKAFTFTNIPGTPTDALVQKSAPPALLQKAGRPAPMLQTVPETKETSRPAPMLQAVPKTKDTKPAANPHFNYGKHPTSGVILVPSKKPASMDTSSASKESAGMGMGSSPKASERIESTSKAPVRIESSPKTSGTTSTTAVPKREEQRPVYGPMEANKTRCTIQ